MPTKARKSTALPRTYRQVQRWLAARQMSLRHMALAIGRNPGLVWRVVRGEAVSEPIWMELRAFMRSPNRYRLDRSRELKRRAAWAQRVLRETKREQARQRRQSA